MEPSTEPKKSIQNLINEFGGINNVALDSFLKERDMVKSDILDDIQRGQRISYINNKGLFRSGGIVVSNDSDFLVIRCFNGMIFTIKKDTIEAVFKGKVREKKKKSEYSIKFKPLGEVTNYPLIINGETLKYFDKKSRLDKFMTTEKYKKLISGVKWEFTSPVN